MFSGFIRLTATLFDKRTIDINPECIETIEDHNDGSRLTLRDGRRIDVRETRDEVHNAIVVTR